MLQVPKLSGHFDAYASDRLGAHAVSIDPSSTFYLQKSGYFFGLLKTNLRNVIFVAFEHDCIQTAWPNCANLTLDPPWWRWQHLSDRRALACQPVSCPPLPLFPLWTSKTNKMMSIGKQFCFRAPCWCDLPPLQHLNLAKTRISATFGHQHVTDSFFSENQTTNIKMTGTKLSRKVSA